jgi:hypothetical protein
MAENQLEIYGFSLVYAGEFEEASSMVEALCNMHEARRRPGEAKEPQQVHREHIRDLLKTDPEAAHAQLVAWEQQAIKNFKLEKFAN